MKVVDGDKEGGSHFPMVGVLEDHQTHLLSKEVVLIKVAHPRILVVVFLAEEGVDDQICQNNLVVEVVREDMASLVIPAGEVLPFFALKFQGVKSP